MGILKFTFFRVHQTKGNLVRRQWIDLKFDGMACKGYTSTSKNETFDLNVKHKVLNDKKTFKTSTFYTHLCHILQFHYDVKVVFFHFLTFQPTKSSGKVIFSMLEWHKTRIIYVN